VNFAAASNMNPLSGRHVMIVAAHPDDETLGAGACLGDAKRITLVHSTDGSRSHLKAISKGFATREHYGRARQAELRQAFLLLSVEKCFVSLDIRDQRVAFHIAETARALGRIFVERNPDLIVTHAFEGGHPDHDATAMAVHLAWRTLKESMPLYEMTGYHNATGKDVYGGFIPRSETDAICIVLSPEAQARKKAMLAAFASQKSVVRRYPLDSESFRPAPYYEFSAAPHAGTMFYEKHRLAMTWQKWCVLADQASHAFAARSLL